MSNTLVLARKYRPPNFEQMVGQEHVVKALTNALASQRLHHAYLFTGTRGVGKTTVARILAKSLNCIGPDGGGGITPRPCGVCGPCTEIDADRFIDYVEMDAASNRGIDEIRDLLERAAYKPAVGRFKVFMIDEVHQLTKDSFNALLKTLEEPPEYLKFVLATTDPEKVLPTVLSRCLQFNLRPMAPEVLQAHLQKVLGAEGIASEPQALRLLARAARGSMRDALSLADQAIAFGAGTIAEVGVAQMLGTVGRGHVYALFDALAGGDGAAVVASVDRLRAEGQSAEGALEELCTLLQQLAVARVVPETLDADDPESPAVAERVAVLPDDETQLLYSIALHGRGELPLAPDEYSGLVMVLLRMLAFRPAGVVRAAPRVATPSVRAEAPVAASGGSAVVASGGSAGEDSAAAAGAGGTRAAAPSAALSRKPQAVMASVVPARSAVAAREPAPWDDEAPGEPLWQGVAESRPAPAAAAPGANTRAEVAATSRTDVPAAVTAPATSRTAAPATAATAATAATSRPAAVEHLGASESGPVLQARESHCAIVLPQEHPAAPTLAAADRWTAVVRRLVEANAVTAMVRELAMQSECSAVGEGEVSFALVAERESLRQPAHTERLQAALEQLLGHAVALDVAAGKALDTPARRSAAARERRQREAEALFESDPFVVQTLAQVKTARIVPGSIKPI